MMGGIHLLSMKEKLLDLMSPERACENARFKSLNIELNTTLPHA
jgi:hypothetical protein